MKKSIAIVFFLGIIFSAWAQKAVYPLPLAENQKTKANMFHYAMPQTAFEVTVTLTKVREIKGYYTEYAQTLLGLTNVISDNRTYYKIQDVQLKPVTVPDPAHTFLVVPDNDQQQFLLDQTHTPTPWIPNELATYTTQCAPIPNFFQNYSDPSYAEKEDSFTETKIIDGVVTQVPANRTKLVNVTNSQKAQQAADAISKSRLDQYNLVKGEQETAYSQEAISLMLKELKQWEENYLSLFTGLVLEDEITYKFYIYPNTLSTDLFSFNPNKGLQYGFDIDKTDKLYILELNPNMILETVAADPESPAPKSAGFRYRTPVSMQATLVTKEPTSNNRDKLYDFGTVNMYQFGRIQVLPLHQHVDLQKIGFIY